MMPTLRNFKVRGSKRKMSVNDLENEAGEHNSVRSSLESLAQQATEDILAKDDACFSKDQIFSRAY